MNFSVFLDHLNEMKVAIELTMQENGLDKGSTLLSYSHSSLSRYSHVHILAQNNSSGQPVQHCVAKGW